ncbi:MAG: metallophosphoesterase [Gammaproteobacteria bacterium]|nr:metallophosphoesterase [Gammaproteobacteria bacterium]
MHTLNLGKIEGRILIFGGPYSNLEATRAIYAQARLLDVPANNVICTGDLVAYCGEPNETIELIRDWDIPVVMGNCEKSLATGADDCDCGFEEGSSCSILSDKWFDYANALIKKEHRQWLVDLPASISFLYSGFNCQVIHAGVSSINQFIFESDSLMEKSKQIRQAKTDIIIGGHSGIPFGQKVEAGYWLNAGVIGMPANDGCCDTWYMLLDAKQEGVSACWHRLSYAADLSRQSTVAAGMIEYGQALVDGLWPGEDVLPQWEKRQRGKPIQLQCLTLL